MPSCVKPTVMGDKSWIQGWSGYTCGPNTPLSPSGNVQLKLYNVFIMQFIRNIIWYNLIPLSPLEYLLWIRPAILLSYFQYKYKCIHRVLCIWFSRHYATSAVSIEIFVHTIQVSNVERLFLVFGTKVM
jgi:hypothetical protein